MRSPAFPEGSLIRSSALAWITSAVPPLANKRIASVAQRYVRVFHSELGGAVRFHREVRHVARVRLGSHRVVNAVVRIGWVEVASRSSERGPFAFRGRVDMDGVFARRQILEVQRDSYSLATWPVGDLAVPTSFPVPSFTATVTGLLAAKSVALTTTLRRRQSLVFSLVASLIEIETLYARPLYAHVKR